MEELGAWLAALDWRPLFISLKTGIIATVISFFLGIFAAWKIARMKNRWRAVIDGILTLPMVLPPTACGFFLLMIFSRRRLVGRFFGYNF